MVGEVAFVHAVRELKALSRAHAFETLLVAFPTVPLAMRPVLRRLGLPVLDPGRGVLKFLRTHGGGRFKGSPLTLGSDPHPSVAGHALMADALFDRLVDSGFIARQLAKP
jgi:hypothetical protein